MIMAGFEFAGKIPFRDVYIHGTVRDEKGKKMSKSLGNIIDPLDIIEAFGADALRFSIISITSTGQDVFLSKEKFTIGRNFANKIWNAARFVLMNLKKPLIVDSLSSIDKDLSLADRWILSRLNHTIDSATKSLDNYRFNEAANLLYEFFWHQFCDWYLELAKLDINAPRVQAILIHVLDSSLRLLHPFMPFVTEEIWQTLPHEGSSIMVAPWPKVDKSLIEPEAERKMQLIIDEVTAIRNIRSDWKVPSSKRVDVVFSCHNKSKEVLIDEHSSYIKSLARTGKVTVSKKASKPEGSATAIVGDVTIYVELKGLIDLKKEAKRLSGEVDKVSGELDAVRGKLKNKEFLAKAPETIIANEKLKQENLKERKKKLQDHLKSLR